MVNPLNRPFPSLPHGSHLGWDIDDVLARFTLTILERWATEHGGIAPSMREIATHKFHEIWNCVPEEARDFVHAFMRAEGHTLKPMDWASFALRLLGLRYLHDAITSRSPEFEGITRLWQEIVFPGLFESLNLVGNPESGTVVTTKRSEAQRLGIAAMFEDRLEYALDIAAIGIPVILFGDYGYNQLEVLPPLVWRARNFEEVLDLVMPDWREVATTLGWEIP